jgi:hypothetical protein
MNIVRIATTIKNPHQNGSPEFRDYRNQALRNKGFRNVPNNTDLPINAPEKELPIDIICTFDGKSYFQYVELESLDPQVATQLLLEGDLI